MKDGVSLINCCMNRNDDLKITLDTWLNVEDVDEIILVDWSSPEPVENLIPKNTNGKTIKVARVEGQERWVLSWAYNLAASLASFNKLLKIDADIILMPNLLKLHPLKKGAFYHGSWQLARNNNELHLNGQMYCWAENFWAVNGYNERIVSYGWDDDDLYWRLKSRERLKENALDKNLLHHISGNFKKE